MNTSKSLVTNALIQIEEIILLTDQLKNASKCLHCIDDRTLSLDPHTVNNALIEADW